MSSLIDHVGLLDAGLTPTLVKVTSELIARKDNVGLNRQVSIIFTLYLAAGGMAALVLVGISMLLADGFKVPADRLFAFRLGLCLASIQVGLAFPLSVWRSITVGLQEASDERRQRCHDLGQGPSASGPTPGRSWLPLSGGNDGNCKRRRFDFLRPSGFKGAALAACAADARDTKKERWARSLDSAAPFFSVALLGQAVFESSRLLIPLFWPIAYVAVYENSPSTVELFPKYHLRRFSDDAYRSIVCRPC